MKEFPFLFESIKTVVPSAQKRSFRENGMRFIKATTAIKRFPFTIKESTEQFAPIPWLQPKEELLEQPLYQ